MPGEHTSGYFSLLLAFFNLYRVNAHDHLKEVNAIRVSRVRGMIWTFTHMLTVCSALLSSVLLESAREIQLGNTEHVLEGSTEVPEVFRAIILACVVVYSWSCTILGLSVLISTRGFTISPWTVLPRACACTS